MTTIKSHSQKQNELKINWHATMAANVKVDPNKTALVKPIRRTADGKYLYSKLSYKELYDRTVAFASGLSAVGMRPGERIVFLLPPSLEMVPLIFACIDRGLIPVFIDPGMGIKNMATCIEEAKPDYMFGVRRAHLLRLLFPKAFKTVKGFFADISIPFLAKSYLNLRKRGPITELEFNDNTLMGIFFTSGSTGVPKGVEWTHGNMYAQLKLMPTIFDLFESEKDLATFPLFILISIALGKTCILADMDFARPGAVNPKNITDLIIENEIGYAFGSPALWRRVSDYCLKEGIVLSSVRRVISAGAPVGTDLLASLRQVAPNSKIYTPYGATEALPVSIADNALLETTAGNTKSGAGICVGFPVDGVEVRIIRTSTEQITYWSDELTLGPREIGEITVSGPNVTRRYFGRPLDTALSKIFDLKNNGGKVWHRMGDLGYFDEQGRLWYCGRLKHLTEQDGHNYYPVQVEGIVNCIDGIDKSALVNIVVRGEKQLAVVVQAAPATDFSILKKNVIERCVAFGIPISIVLRYEGALPVDRRHNAKIERGLLSKWAQAKFG